MANSRLRSNREAAGMPSIKHYLFFRFLLFSPSYYLAHQILDQKLEVSKKDYPHDFEKVLALYRRLGNIYSVCFDVWWDKVGINVLATDYKTTKVVLKIDLNKSKQEILNGVEQYLDSVNFDVIKDKKDKIYFLNNKIRVTTLNERLTLVETRSLEDSDFLREINPNKKRLPYWKIGMYARPFVPSFHFGKAYEEVIEDGIKGWHNKKRMAYITMLVSKNLREALDISENAARGIFPSKEKSASQAKFNYGLISDIFLNSIVLYAEEEERKNKLGLTSYINESRWYKTKQFKNKAMIDKALRKKYDRSN